MTKEMTSKFMNVNVREVDVKIAAAAVKEAVEDVMTKFREGDRIKTVESCLIPNVTGTIKGWTHTANGEVIYEVETDKFCTTIYPRESELIPL